MKAPKSVRSIHTLAGEVVVGEIRTEMWGGKEYLVAPVVALVEGVLQGINSPVPELALAAEFGKYPQGWNGRPLVMNHPTTSSGPVSAGDPAILEAWAFGQMFNTTLDDKKLKTEAWIDVALATAKGGEFASTLKRLQDKVMVEVSVGCFVSTYSAKGIYNQRAYQAVWTDVVPDHLALLSEGTLGACSIETGCGTPRVNKGTPMTTVNIVNKDPKVKVEVKANCSCGGDHPAEPTVAANTDADELLETLEADRSANLASCRRVGLSIESVPENFFTDDIRTMLSKAVRKTYSAGGESTYLVGFTTNLAVYEIYMSGKGYCTYQVPFTMDAQGTVTFSGTPVEITLITQIMPVQNQRKDETMTTKTADELAAEALAANATAPKPAPVATPAAAPVAPASAPASAPPSNPPPPTNAAAAPTEPKVEAKVDEKPVKYATVADYVAAAPAELQEVLNEGIRLQAEKKAKLIKVLVDAKERCTFSEEELKAMGVPMLEKLAKLADAPDYSGGAGTRQAENPLATNADGEINGYAAAPTEELFPVNGAVKKSTAGTEATKH